MTGVLYVFMNYLFVYKMGMSVFGVGLSRSIIECIHVVVGIIYFKNDSELKEVWQPLKKEAF